MQVICIDASDNCGRGTGLLTEGKEYTVYGTVGGYYDILCDNGRKYSKSKNRFKVAKYVHD